MSQNYFMKKGLIGLILGNGLSKIIGLLREVLVAYWFGTSFIADAYRVALSVILLPTQLLMGDAFQSTFIPQYKKNVEKGTQHKLFGAIFFSFCILALVMVGILFGYADKFVNIISPGFSEQASQFTTYLVKVMALAIPFYIISYLFVYVLNSYGDFKFSSVAAVNQNLFLIVFSALAYFLSKPLLMGIGFVAPFFVLMIILTLYTFNNKIIEFKSFKLELNSFFLLNDFWRTMIPLLMYMLILQSNIVVERIVSSNLGEGVVASIDYARFLYETPLYLLAIPIGTVGLTYFSNTSWEENRERIEDVIIIASMIFIPFSSILFTESKIFVEILYGRGEFTEKSIVMTAQALTGFSMGLWAAGISIILQKIYSAYFRNKEILIFSGISVLLNIIFNISLSDQLGILGVSLAYSLSMILQLILLLWGLKINCKKILITIILLLSSSLCYQLFFSPFENLNIFGRLILLILIFMFYWLLIFLVFPLTRNYLLRGLNLLSEYYLSKVKKN